MSRDFSSRPRGRAPWSMADRVLVAAAAVLFAAVGWLALGAWNDHRHASERVRTLRQNLADARSRAQAAESRRGSEDPVVGRALLTAEAPPGKVLGALAALLPPDVRLDGLTLRYGGRLDVDLRVAARDARAYDLFLSRLEASPLFEGVEPGEESREGEVRTSVRASFKRGVS